MEKYLAKSRERGGTTLLDHVYACINLSYLLVDKYITNFEEIKPIALYATGCHDIGKIVECWQKYYQGKYKEKTTQTNDDNDGSDPTLRTKNAIMHNVISWAFLKNNTSIGTYNLTPFHALCSGVLYHHVVDEEYDSPNAIISKYPNDKEKMCEFFNCVKDYISNSFGFDKIDGKVVEICDNNDKTSSISKEVIYPEMGNNDNRKGELKEFSLYFLLRSIVIISDRLVSSLDKEELAYFVSNDTEYMTVYLENICKYTNTVKVDFGELVKNGYDEKRLEKQFELVDAIIPNKNTILSASAGSGKTLLGVLLSIKQGKKTVWVVPTNFTAMSTYKSVTSELEKMGYSDSISVSLYYGGHFEFGDEDADILITNIDTFLGTMIKNCISHWLFKFLNGVIIFDEYHEFVGSPNTPMFSGFIATAYCLMKYTKSSVLCMSATAHRYDEIFWGEDLVRYMQAEIYGGDIPVMVKVKRYGSIDEFEIENKDSIAVMHSIPNVTNYGIKHLEQGFIFAHSRFPEEEIMPKLLGIIENHGKHGECGSRNPLIGTSFIGFALDITTDNMYDFVVSPDTTIQRGCGRVNRFCNSQNLGIYNMCIFVNGKTPRIVSTSYDAKLLNRWIAVIEEYEDKVIPKKKFYELYEKFYEDNKLDIINFFTSRFVNSSVSQYGLSKLLPYHSRYTNAREEKTLPKGKLTFRGVTSDIYVTAHKKNGTLCKPIKIKTCFVSDFEGNLFGSDRPLSKEICKKQFNYYLDCLGKDNLEYSFGVSDWMNIWKIKADSNDVKYDISRRSNSPLLLTISEAEFNDELGLILK